jgi:PPOX class probable F420-dependent enzyme
MDDKVRAFLESNRAAAMVTLRTDGTPHVVRIGLALVDGKLWSSGTQTRLRTRHLRRDPRCTLFVFGEGPGYLGLETTVTILDGSDVPDQSVKLFQTMQPNATPGTLLWFGQPRTYDEFKRLMVEEQRLIYEFEIKRAYGLYEPLPQR